MASESDGDGRTTGRGSGDDDDDDCKKTWDDICQEAIRLDASDDIGEPITVRSHLLPFKFKLDESTIYGRCPSIERRLLVVCDVCKRFVLASAFRHHYECRHAANRVESKNKRRVVESTTTGGSGEVKPATATPVTSSPLRTSPSTASGAVPAQRLPCKRGRKASLSGDERVNGGSPAKRKIVLPPPNEQKVRSLGYDPDRHCGVWMTDQRKYCHRSLTCKTHSLGLRRKVPNRRKLFDELLAEHRHMRYSLMSGLPFSAESGGGGGGGGGGESAPPSSDPSHSSSDQNPNHVIRASSQSAKKGATSKRKDPIVDPVVVVAEEHVDDIVLDSGQVEDIRLSMSNLMPMPVGVCAFGAKRCLPNASTYYVQSMDKLKSHLNGLKSREKEASGCTANLGKPPDLSEATISSAPAANLPALPLACSYQFNPARRFSSNAGQHRIEGRGTSHLRIAKGQLMAVNGPAVSTPNNVLPLPPKGLLCGAPPQATAATSRSRSSRKSQSSSQSKQAVAQTATPSSHVSPPPAPPVQQQQQQGILMQSADHPLPLLPQNHLQFLNGSTFEEQQTMLNSVKSTEDITTSNVNMQQLQQTSVASISSQVPKGGGGGGGGGGSNLSQQGAALLTPQQRFQMMKAAVATATVAAAAQSGHQHQTSPQFAAQQLAYFPPNFLLHPQIVEVPQNAGAGSAGSGGGGGGGSNRVKRPSKLDLAIMGSHRILQPKQVAPSPTSNPSTPRAILPNTTQHQQQQQRVASASTPVPSPSPSQVSTVT